MKKIFLALLLATTVGFTACEANNEEPEPGPGPGPGPTTVEVTSVTLREEPLTLEVGRDSTFLATVLPDNATNKTVTWTSTATGVATVNEDGKVIAVSAGQAKIIAKAGELADTCVVTVEAAVVPVESVTLREELLTLEVGQDSTFLATVLPENATDKTVTWTSSDEEVATVNENGKVTAVKAGGVNIIATVGELADTCSIIVVSDIVLDSGTAGPLTWKITEDSTLTISGNGAIPDYGYPDYAPWYANEDKIKRVVIKEGVTGIGNYTFYYCFTLTDVTLPESLTNIEEGAFNGCRALNSVNLPEGLTNIGKDAFYFCTALTSITIPEEVASIGVQAFSYCTKLTNITIPAGVTSIGDMAFNNCSKLTNVTMLGRITSIEQATFYKCTALTSITIPEGVTTIGTAAFFDCTALTSVTLPESLTSIGSSAFNNCTALSSVTCLATTPPELVGGFNFLFNNDTLYVPAGSVAAYQAHPEWSAVFTTITAIPE